MDIVSSCTQFPLQNTWNSFQSDESFLVDRNDHMVQMDPLCGTIDRGKVLYSFLLDTIADIETQMYQPNGFSEYVFRYGTGRSLLHQAHSLHFFSGKYIHLIPCTSFCELLVKSSGVWITIFPPSLLHRRCF